MKRYTNVSIEMQCNQIHIMYCTVSVFKAVHAHGKSVNVQAAGQHQHQVKRLVHS